MRDSRFRTFVRRGLGASLTLTLVAIGLAFGPAAQAATFNVNCNKGQNLQDKLNSAPSGSTILIEGTCYGNFAIVDFTSAAPGRTLTLKGNPTATLDGMDTSNTLFQLCFDFSFSTFCQQNLHLFNLTITGGAQTGAGGGIDALQSGVVTLNHVNVVGNEVNTGSEGGGVWALGNLSVSSSSIKSNRVDWVANQTSTAYAQGGGLFANSNLTVTNSVISGNHVTVTNTDGSNSSVAEGGGLTSYGKLIVSGSQITGNRVGANDDGPGALGAAVDLESTIPASINTSAVSGNAAGAVTSGSGNPDAGFTIYAPTSPSSLTMSGTKIIGNVANANGGSATGVVEALGAYVNGNLALTNSLVQGNHGTASGDGSLNQGTLLASTVHLTNSKVLKNVAAATSTGTGGSAVLGGAILGDALTLSKSTVDGTVATATSSGGAGVIVGAALEATSVTANGSTLSRTSGTAKTTLSSANAVAIGGADLSNTATMNNSTVALNHLTAIAGTSSGNGTAQGGGLFLENSSPSTLTDATVAANKVSASGGGTITSQGGGLFAGNQTSLLSTIIGTNSAPPLGGPDCFGGPTSAGYNLIGNKTGCSWVSTVGDKTNKNPQLGTLKNQGGPTQTMGIKATSPAHNAVPTGVCPFHTDQRGVHRPQGSKCDMGAFELMVGEVVKSALGLASSTVRSAGGTESGAISPAATLPRAIILRVLGHSLPSPFAVSRRFPGPSRAAIHAQAIQYAKQKLAWARMVSR